MGEQRLCVSQRDRGGSPCLYVHAFVSVWASEDERIASNRDSEEMDEVCDVYIRMHLCLCGNVVMSQLAHCLSVCR